MVMPGAERALSLEWAQMRFELATKVLIGMLLSDSARRAAVSLCTLVSATVFARSFDISIQKHPSENSFDCPQER